MAKSQILCEKNSSDRHRRLHNRYYAKTMRNAVRKLRATTDKAAAVELPAEDARQAQDEHHSQEQGFEHREHMPTKQARLIRPTAHGVAPR